MPELSVGDVGPEVLLMTRRLAFNGFSGVLGKAYTESVQAAVIAFQTAKGLSPDGIVGDRTWLALSQLHQIEHEANH